MGVFFWPTTLYTDVVLVGARRRDETCSAQLATGCSLGHMGGPGPVSSDEVTDNYTKATTYGDLISYRSRR